MKEQIKVWGSRVLSIAVIAFVALHWGAPLYKRYFTAKKTAAFVPTGKVKAGRFVVSFHEIGNMQAEKSVGVMSEVNGKIITLVSEGKVVKKGDRLVELDTADIKRELQTQVLNYENAVNDVNSAKAEFELLKKSNMTDLAQATKELDFKKNELVVARNELQIATSDLDRMKRLYEKKLIPVTQVEQAEATVRSREGEIRSKQLEIDKAELQLQLKNEEVKTKESQKAGGVANVGFRAEMAKRQMEEVQGRLKGSTIIAPAGGMVVLEQTWDSSGRRSFKEGDSVNPRQTVIQLPDLTKMLVLVQVGEADAPKVKVGMGTNIRLEAIPDKQYHGKVRDVSPLASMGMPWDPGATAGRKSFQVKIEVTEADPRTMKPGMTADVEFICDTVSDTMYVPIESVIEREGKTFVYVRRGKEFILTKVTVGKHNDNFVQIKSGLRAGQIVALKDPTKRNDDEGEGAEGKDDKKGAAPIPESGPERKKG